MASSIKIIISSIFILLLIASVLAVPGKSHHKIRIHIPVKHHTHIITKTKVKTVHVGVPIKEPTKHGWDEQWAYSKKRPVRVRLPSHDDIDDY